MRHRLVLLIVAVLCGCASPDVLLLGEQHDAPAHQAQQLRVVEELAGRGQLAALALEMAEQGRTTAGLAATATQEQVRAALAWDDAGWPWAAYAPAVMAAVRAGVPVVGANLPRARMRAAMNDETLDRLLAEPALAAQREAIRAGHCGLLPESQIAPMTRIQIARDRAMAEVLDRAASRGKTVVLISGAGHADPALGVPRYLPANRRVHSLILPAQPPQRDYCEQLRR
jgi:uncharacterized iron-regulated protein